MMRYQAALITDNFVLDVSPETKALVPLLMSFATMRYQARFFYHLF
ncbi:hypothetical protein ACRRS0_05650 [Agarivorans sp. QJM3NY_29]